MTIRVTQEIGRSPRGQKHATQANPTGLEWAGNENVSLRRMLYWASPFAIYPATYIFRAFPKGPKTGTNPRYWTMFFWGNNGNFSWDNDDANAYYGAHPYPFDGIDQSTGQNWEISTKYSDFEAPEGTQVDPWNRWYTQVFRARSMGSEIWENDFYWDWPDTNKVIDGGFFDSIWMDSGNPPTPCICVGQAPDINGVGANSGNSWGNYPGYEEYKGILRGMQFYDAFLSESEIAQEVANPGSFRTPWYLNLNPTPDDVTDKSGSGNHPLWDGASRPTLWTG